ncbi:MAG: DUF2878 domain-containing protein [Sedimentisphaerales bacterium]|nr:DUF2878 domain-containing protein [Sedimentisphaerales bacterium]
MKVTWNILSLNIGWFACVLGAANGMPWLGLLVVPLLVFVHIFVCEKSKPFVVLKMGAICIGLGWLMDSFLIIIGAYDPVRWLLPHPSVTIWLLMLWLNFSLSLNESLRWLQSHPFSAVILGAIFGPLAYLAGARLGALLIPSPQTGLVLIGLTWMVAMPLLSHIAARFYRPVTASGKGNG